MNWTEVATGLIGLGLTVFGVGFAMWSRKLDKGTASVEKMGDSIREVVNMRLGSMSNHILEIRDDVKGMRQDLHDHSVRLAVIETNHVKLKGDE